MNIKTNSRYVKKNDIFVCIHDELEDRHKYINNIKKARAIVVDKDIKNTLKIPFIKVKNTNDTLFDIYNNYYNNPLEKLNLLGITGTDGKTTTAYLIKELLNSCSKTAYLGTLGFYYNNKKLKTVNTTVSTEAFFNYANILNREGFKNLSMEISSEGLLHNRCNNLTFKRTIITNVTGDHLNIHKTFDNYLNTKLKLFLLLEKEGIAIINTDDISYAYIKKMGINILGYGFGKDADYRIKNYVLTDKNTCFTLVFNDKEYKIISPLLGKFNIYNLTAAIACINSLGIDIETIIENINDVKLIPGRMNVFKTKDDARVILDYAHTANATKEILDFANSVGKRNIITVLGCAGGREKRKRKEIGKIATALSDRVIFTMDDPRYEKVDDIVNDMTKGIKTSNYTYIKNRKKAIKYAIKISKKDDIILVLGKGTDDYMAVKNKHKKYNDLKVIKKYTIH